MLRRNLQSGIATYTEHLKHELVTPFAIAGVLGLCLLALDRQRYGRAGRVLVICVLFYVVAFHLLANIFPDGLFQGVLARFWQQPDMIFCLALAASISAIL
jgi:hypothetical protein